MIFGNRNIFALISGQPNQLLIPLTKFDFSRKRFSDLLARRAGVIGSDPHSSGKSAGTNRSGPRHYAPIAYS
jgi:hypothetical protein